MPADFNLVGRFEMAAEAGLSLIDLQFYTEAKASMAPK